MKGLARALFSFLIGIALGVPGLCLLVFLCLLMWRPGLAPDWLRWVEAHSPLAPADFPRQFFDELSQGKSPWAAWGAAAFLSFVGYTALRGARESLRPADHSRGGAAQVVIKTEYPCVGAVLEGDLKLLETPKPDQVFRVTLLCRHIDRALSEERRSSLFGQSRDVKIAQLADGWHLPFRFEVPADAPPSTPRDDLAEVLTGPPSDEYSWFIEFFPTDKWIVVPSKFKITLGAAPVNAPRA
ncbi:MAG: hypothetical protein JWQ76_818 [Ramlibacter sp.]|nr:hypothetical protein [Ramlibacter sp.]